MAQYISSCNKHSYKHYIIREGRTRENDFIMVNGAVELNVVVQHVCRKGWFSRTC